jgi:sugar lactone lactonase YvrE
MEMYQMPDAPNKISVIADYNDSCGEAPLWDERTQLLYWTDIARKRTYRYEWPAGKHVMLQEGFEVAGLLCNESGGFVVVNSEGVWFWDGQQSRSILAGRTNQNCCSLNDCIADVEGRIFSGSCFFDPSARSYPLGSLFCIDTDATVRIVDDGLRLSNGIGFSPDNSTMYLADSAGRLIYAYDYERADGSLSNRRIFVRVPIDQGIPDGLAVDAEGFVWSAQWFGGCLVRYDPDGRVERRVEIPARQTSSLAFGGADLTDVFVTSASVSDALPLAPRGYKPEAEYAGGKVFHFNIGIAGRTKYRSRIAKRIEPPQY